MKQIGFTIYDDGLPLAQHIDADTVTTFVDLQLYGYFTRAKNTERVEKASYIFNWVSSFDKYPYFARYFKVTGTGLFNFDIKYAMEQVSIAHQHGSKTFLEVLLVETLAALRYSLTWDLPRSSSRFLRPQSLSHFMEGEDLFVIRGGIQTFAAEWTKMDFLEGISILREVDRLIFLYLIRWLRQKDPLLLTRHKDLVRLVQDPLLFAYQRRNGYSPPKPLIRTIWELFRYDPGTDL